METLHIEIPEKVKDLRGKGEDGYIEVTNEVDCDTGGTNSGTIKYTSYAAGSGASFVEDE